MKEVTAADQCRMECNQHSGNDILDPAGQSIFVQKDKRLQNNSTALLIRADANPTIGTGHIMRCLALAQSWQDSYGRVTFLMAPGSPSLEQRISSEGMNVVSITEQPGSENDAKITADIAKKIKSSWVIVDGYQFDGEYQKILKKQNCKFLFIDDYGHANHYYADLVLNQNISADRSLYTNSEPYTRFLLGSRFVLLRREFLKWAGHQREIAPVARKVLLTLGGSDPDNITLKMIEILKKINIDGLELIVVAGGLNPNFVTLEQSVKNYPLFSIKRNVENMPELMAWADVAISAGGSTCWELAFSGLPGILIILSRDQELNVSGLSKQGAAISIDRPGEINSESIIDAISGLIYSPDKRYAMSHMGKTIVDGNGTHRIISEIRGN
jgi:UDP-2,4-diacetamido-2,4,6-trideoxy-beta-L-altropyranose hydrolase